MKFAEDATQPAIDAIGKYCKKVLHRLLNAMWIAIQKANFDVETKIRTLVAEMLLNMDDKVNRVNRDGKEHKADISKIYRQINEVHTKLDREARNRELVGELKSRIVNMEKGMASDIEKTVANNDELVMNISRLNDHIVEIGRERVRFMVGLDKVRGQMKEYE